MSTTSGSDILKLISSGQKNVKVIKKSKNTAGNIGIVNTGTGIPGIPTIGSGGIPISVLNTIASPPQQIPTPQPQIQIPIQQIQPSIPVQQPQIQIPVQQVQIQQPLIPQIPQLQQVQIQQPSIPQPVPQPIIPQPVPQPIIPKPIHQPIPQPTPQPIQVQIPTISVPISAPLTKVTQFVPGSIRTNLIITDHNYRKSTLKPEQFKPLTKETLQYQILNLSQLDIKYQELTGFTQTKALVYLDLPIHGLTRNFELKNSLSSLVGKTSIHQSDSPIHELFIGVFGTNKLKDLIPNFAYILASFASERKQLTVYEKFPELTLTKFCQTCSFQDFLNLYLQVLFSLELAEHEIKFTHYNLNSESILIKPVQTKAVIRYMNTYLVTDKIALIYDYSTSHIEYQNRSYGAHDLSQFGVSGTHSHLLHDAYKLLLYSLAAMKDNSACQSQALILFRFFNSTDDLKKVLTEQADLFYYLPEAYSDIKITTYLEYIKSNFQVDFLVTDPVDYPDINTNTSRICLDKNIGDLVSGLEINPELSTLPIFYEALLHLQTDQDKIELIQKFKPDQHIPSGHLGNHEKDNDLLVLPIFQSYQLCFRDEYLELFRIYVYDLLNLVQSYQDQVILNNLYNKVLNIYKKPAVIFSFDSNILQKHLIELSSISNKLNNSTKEEREFGIQEINKNAKYNWYFSDLITLTAIIKNKIENLS